MHRGLLSIVIVAVLIKELTAEGKANMVSNSAETNQAQFSPLQYQENGENYRDHRGYGGGYGDFGGGTTIRDHRGYGGGYGDFGGDIYRDHRRYGGGYGDFGGGGSPWYRKHRYPYYHGRHGHYGHPHYGKPARYEQGRYI